MERDMEIPEAYVGALVCLHQDLDLKQFGTMEALADYIAVSPNILDPVTCAEFLESVVENRDLSIDDLWRLIQRGGSDWMFYQADEIRSLFSLVALRLRQLPSVQRAMAR
jgi:hypothetical protein